MLTESLAERFAVLVDRHDLECGGVVEFLKMDGFFGMSLADYLPIQLGAFAMNAAGGILSDECSTHNLGRIQKI